MFSALYPLFFSVCEALGAISDFFGGLIPVMTAYLAFGGAGGTAAGAASGLSLTLWLTGLTGERLLMPMTAAVFASSAVSSAVGGAAERSNASIGRSFKRIMGAVCAVVAAVFALQTYVCSAADSVSVRAAKYAASGLVPSVGGVVSGALGALCGGLSMLGGLIGASSVAVIIAMALSPLVLLLMYKLSLYICTLYLEFTGTDTKGSPIGAFMGALDTLISVYVMTIIIYIFEVIVVVWGGRSVFG
jgi:stage III sporulation protein AE